MIFIFHEMIFQKQEKESRYFSVVSLTLISTILSNQFNYLQSMTWGYMKAQMQTVYSLMWRKIKAKVILFPLILQLFKLSRNIIGNCFLPWKCKPLSNIVHSALKYEYCQKYSRHNLSSIINRLLYLIIFVPWSILDKKNTLPFFYFFLMAIDQVNIDWFMMEGSSIKNGKGCK